MLAAHRLSGAIATSIEAPAMARPAVAATDANIAYTTSFSLIGQLSE